MFSHPSSLFTFLQESRPSAGKATMTVRHRETVCAHLSPGKFAGLPTMAVPSTVTSNLDLDQTPPLF
jgi:hypothetical protein